MDVPVTDEQLYQAWALGDRTAGSRLVDRFVRPIARFFANKVADAPDAEDLVGETFEICARKLGDFACEGSFRSYLFGIAHNVLRNYLRRKRRHGREIDPETDSIAMLGPSLVTAIASKREHTLLLRALRSVPIELQVVLELAHFEQMSRTEIALALGMPAGTVASRLRRANELLEAKLAELAEHPDLARSTIHGLTDWAAELRVHIDATRRAPP